MNRRWTISSTREFASLPSQTLRPVKSLPDVVQSPTIDQYGGGKKRNRKRRVSNEDLTDMCRIETSQRRIKNRGGGSVKSIEVHSLRFEGLEYADEPISLLIPRLLNKFILDTLKEQRLDPETARFCIALHHKDIDSGFFFQFQTFDTLNGESIYLRLQKFQQSSKVINIDSELAIEMHIHTPKKTDCSAPPLPGRGGESEFFDSDMKLKKIIKNQDNLCLARAFVVAKLTADRQHISAHNGKEEAKEIARMCRNVTRNEEKQKFGALDLLKKCGIPTDKEVYTTNDLSVIAENYPEYHIRLFTRDFGQKVYSLAEGCSWNVEGAIILNLAYRDGHYDVFHPKKTTLKHTVCKLCHELYSRKERHRCVYICKLCKTRGCQQGSTIQKICDDCNIYFEYEACYKRHLKKIRTKSICDKFKLCPECGKHYGIHNVKSEGHVCNTRWCPLCRAHVGRNHDCSWSPPTEAQKTKAIEKQQNYKIIVYDFETVQTQNSDPDSFNEEHFVNVVCWAKFCQECRDQDQELPCTNCVQKSRHFKYDSPSDSPWKVVDQFLDFLLFDKSNDGSLLFAHNAACFDVHFIIRRLFAKGVYPDIICNGNKVMLMHVKPGLTSALDHNKLSFKDSFLLIPQPLATLPQAFGIPNQEKGTFPYLFNIPENYGKVFPLLPPRKFYNVKQMKKKALEAFNNWHDENWFLPFDFDAEILRYCETDVTILRSALIAYMKAFLDLTSWNPLIHATTYASFSMFVLKMDSLQRGQVGVLPENGYTSGEQQSEIALKYIQYIEQRDGLELQYKLRGGEFQVSTPIGNFRVDAFDEQNSTVYEIHGCWYHGCPKCTHPETKHPLYNISMKELHYQTKRRVEAIREEGFTVIEVYEHDIREQILNNAAMKAFFADCKFFTRLRPRDSFLGGRTQPFRLYAQENPEKGETIEYLDFVSLYPWVTSRIAEYPKGQPTVITENFKPILPGKRFPYRGLIKCLILAPQDLYFPIIGQRLNGKLILANCRSCAENGLNEECTHEDINDRAFVTTVCDYELNVALSEGYRILKLYEVWHWPNCKWERGGLFKEFTDKFLTVKQEASGWPKDCSTAEQKMAYIEEIEQNVGIRLDASRISKNLPLRTVSKLSLNSSWGKLGQKPDKNQVHFVDCQSNQFAKIISNDTLELVNMIFVTDDIAMLVTKPRQEYIKSASYTNVAYASITTATARIELWKALKRVGRRALYCDTDSVIFIKKDGEDNLEELMGDYLGKLQSEVPEGYRITEFVSIAPKVYSYILENDSKEVKTVLKVKGITLDNEAVKKINHEKLKDMALRLAGGLDTGTIVTERNILVRKLGKIVTKASRKVLEPVMNKVRFFNNLSTVPFGFKEIDKHSTI